MKLSRGLVVAAWRSESVYPEPWILTGCLSLLFPPPPPLPRVCILSSSFFFFLCLQSGMTSSVRRLMPSAHGPVCLSCHSLGLSLPPPSGSALCLFLMCFFIFAFLATFAFHWILYHYYYYYSDRIKSSTTEIDPVCPTQRFRVFLKLKLQCGSFGSGSRTLHS